jgi:hypothetical protein
MHSVLSSPEGVNVVVRRERRQLQRAKLFTRLCAVYTLVFNFLNLLSNINEYIPFREIHSLFTG